MMRPFLVPLALVALATGARSETPADVESKPITMTRSGPGQATYRKVVTAKAKVVSVDQENRVIVLERKGGKTQRFQVGPQVKRLDEIAAGDVVVVKYEEAAVLQFTEAPVEGEAFATAERNAPTDAPGGTVGAHVRGTVTVTAVDPKTRTVVLETQRGELLEVKADKSIDLKKVKPGQKYLGVYDQALAVDVEKAKAPAKKGAQKM